MFWNSENRRSIRRVSSRNHKLLSAVPRVEQLESRLTLANFVVTGKP
jgi:hypothetical protein